jgi:hypothetical protein
VGRREGARRYSARGPCLLLGFRRLRERDYYRDDLLVQRVLGLQRLPDVSTWTRGLAEMTVSNIDAARALNRDLVVERLREEKLPESRSTSMARC